MEPLDQTFDSQRRALFGLCYRMTGSAADAEDLVQETFRRALEHPPTDRAAPLRPWLFTVATHLCIDALRKRKRERYFGPWLPSPVDTDRLELEPSPEARYSALEGASTAFLLALEVLDPRQRAVVILRDVLGLSGPETAAVLAISPENVRVILHRARKALEAYEAERNPPTEPLRDDTRAALRRFMAAFATGDFDAVRDLLAEDCRAITDGGGEFHAAVRVVRGRAQVVELYRNLARIMAAPTWLAEQDHNGLPSIALERPVRSEREARRITFQVELDHEGRIARIHSVLASTKLTAVRFDGELGA